MCVGIVSLGSLADTFDFALEVEGFAGHRVVEVHLHLVAVHLYNATQQLHAVVGHHRDLIADRQQTLLDFAVDGEGLAGQYDDHIGIGLAVTDLGGEREGERVTYAEACDVLFELGQQVTCSENESEGMFGRSGVGNLAFNGQRIAQRYEFFVFYFHVNLLVWREPSSDGFSVLRLFRWGAELPGMEKDRGNRPGRFPPWD